MRQPGGRALGKPLITLAGVVIAFGIVLAQRGLPGRGAGTTPSGQGAPDSPKHQPLKPDSIISVRPAPRPAEEAANQTMPGAAGGSLRIASWNIEWLGKPDDRSGLAKGVAQSAADMADYIEYSGAAIVAVEEVVSREHGTPIRSPEIEAALDVLREKSRHRWQYVLFPGRADGDQLTGLLWNADAVSALDEARRPWDQTRDRPWAVPLPKTRGSHLWNRPPHAMLFSAGAGKTDLVVIVLHMKADYNGDFSAQRKQEAGALVRALPEVKSHFKDQDVVIIGDTNCPNGPEAATRDIEAAGFADLNSAAKPTHWQGGSMDRVFVPKAQPEFKRHAFEVLSDGFLKKRGLAAKDFKRRFSDHFMVVTTVDVGEDDD